MSKERGQEISRNLPGIIFGDKPGSVQARKIFGLNNTDPAISDYNFAGLDLESSVVSDFAISGAFQERGGGGRKKTRRRRTTNADIRAKWDSWLRNSGVAPESVKTGTGAMHKNIGPGKLTDNEQKVQIVYRNKVKKKPDSD